jgi:hypothetical protein
MDASCCVECENIDGNNTRKGSDPNNFSLQKTISLPSPTILLTLIQN